MNTDQKADQILELLDHYAENAGEKIMLLEYIKTKLILDAAADMNKG